MSNYNPTWEHQVQNVKGKVRIIDYCGKVFKMLGTKSATKKALQDDRILLNGRTAYSSDYIVDGDMITLKGTGVRRIRKLDLELDIIYDDDYLVIVNKPGGIAVNGNRHSTVENAIIGQAKPSNSDDALPRPVAAHRLDVPTKGLLLFGKTKTTLSALSKAFQDKEIKKEYQAVVHGKTEKSGIMESPIDDKSATTKYFTLETSPSRVYGNLSLVKLVPITGRTHQLRIHLKKAGYLIVGDKLYAGEQKTLLGKGVYLCSTRLKFTHPITKKKMDFKLDTPSKFLKLIKREASRFNNISVDKKI